MPPDALVVTALDLIVFPGTYVRIGGTVVIDKA